MQLKRYYKQDVRETILMCIRGIPSRHSRIAEEVCTNVAASFSFFTFFLLLAESVFDIPSVIHSSRAIYSHTIVYQLIHHSWKLIVRFFDKENII